ncbi:MAG TPA: hemolysin family protein [Acidimicrobiia bacterium]|nr:hemolysin family protein [Acidimicrobiia bacterium]
METGDFWAVILAAALVVGSAFVVAAESAVSSTSRIRALAWAEEGRRGAARLARVLEAPEPALGAAALVRSAARATAWVLVAVVGWRQGGAGGAAAAAAGLIVVVLVIGELLPRRVAARYPDATARMAAAPVAALGRVRPLTALAAVKTAIPTRRSNGASSASESEEGETPTEAGGDGEIDPEEQQLIHSIFEFGDTIVREVMVPRTDMVAVDADATVDAALDVAIPAGYSRLPVHGDTPDNVIGLVYVKDLFRSARRGGGSRRVTDVMRKAVFVPEQKRVAELLREMQTRKFHMAIAVDEYGDIAGLVTLEDLLEEIVGEIEDEYDIEEPRVEDLGDGVLRVAGRTPIDEINDLLGVELPDGEWDTVGGLVFDLVGHVPAEGEAVTFQGIEFETERVQGRRIVSVRVRAEPSRADASHPA